MSFREIIGQFTLEIIVQEFNSLIRELRAQFRAVTAYLGGSINVVAFGGVEPGGGLTEALETLAALPDERLDLFIPAGTWVLPSLITFTDKRLRISGAGRDMTVIQTTTDAAGILFIDTNNSVTDPRKFEMRSLTILKGNTTTPGNGGVPIEGRWGYTGYVSSVPRATFTDISVLGLEASKYFDKGIRLVDGGMVTFNRVNLLNVGLGAFDNDVTRSACSLEIVKQNASGMSQFYVNSCSWGLSNTVIQLTHAASPTGPIEGIYLSGACEFGGRHLFLDDNTTKDTNHVVNVVELVGVHAQISKSLIKSAGVWSSLMIDSCQFTFGQFDDPSPVLDGGLDFRGGRIQVCHIIGGRGFNNTPDAVPFIRLPTSADVNRVRVDDICVDGAWGAVLDQQGTQSTDTATQVYLGPGIQRGSSPAGLPVPLMAGHSNIQQGAGLQPARVIFNLSPAVSLTGTTAETALATITIPRGAMGPNGAVRVKLLATTNDGTDTRTLRYRWGGIGGTTMRTVSFSTFITLVDEFEVFNRNNAASQLATGALAPGGFGLSASNGVGGTVDTDAATVGLVVTGELSNAADTMVLRYCRVELFYGA
jgi:hypothetical protein